MLQWITVLNMVYDDVFPHQRITPLSIAVFNHRDSRRVLLWLCWRALYKSSQQLSRSCRGIPKYPRSWSFSSCSELCRLPNGLPTRMTRVWNHDPYNSTWEILSNTWSVTQVAWPSCTVCVHGSWTMLYRGAWWIAGAVNVSGAWQWTMSSGDGTLKFLWWRNNHHNSGYMMVDDG